MDTMRTTYRELSADENTQVLTIKALGKALLVPLAGRLDGAAGGERELAIARTKVEEAVMWAVKGITG